MFEPSRKLSPGRKLVNVVRNLWFLRGELWAIIRRKRAKQEPGVALTCIVCRHDLTKPCRRGRTRHLVVWPESMDGVGDFTKGQLVEVRRQKPRSGRFQQDEELRPLLNHGEPVFR